MTMKTAITRMMKSKGEPDSRALLASFAVNPRLLNTDL